MKSVLQMAGAAAGRHRWAGNISPKLLILTYHRVLPRESSEIRYEQPGMYVTPETFEMHLTELSRYFQFTHLDDWVRIAMTGEKLPKRSCAITFDDGWRDNFTHAFPVLSRMQVPATCFVVTGLVGTDSEFWPNRVARMLENGEQQTDMVEGELGRILKSAALDLKSCTPAMRAEIISEAIEACKRFPDEDIVAELDRATKGTAAAAGLRSLLNWEEIAEMASGDLVRFGSHSRTHKRLPKLESRDRVREEIGDSRLELERRLDQVSRIFCYPNGDFNPLVQQLVAEHYDAAVSTRSGYNSTSTDRYALQRISIHDDATRTRKSFLSRVGGFV